jgi:sterol desaturase/sphingolipid hydroxylase (fatty acid hydroxylase superfamily)
MKRGFLPYYVSRALLSGAFSIVVFGFTWKALVLAVFLFGLFLLYLHSGWFNVDRTNPLFPLRRDERGREAQRKAMIAALIAGVGVFLVLSAITLPAASLAAPAPLAVSLSIIVYFGSQFVLLATA